MNCFGFFIIFLVFFTVFVYPHHDHLITTVLSHCSPYSLFVAKVPLNTNQRTYRCTLLLNAAVKELLKVIYMCQSYRQNKSGIFF